MEVAFVKGVWLEASARGGRKAMISARRALPHAIDKPPDR
jgi:hypothetical protein